MPERRFFAQSRPNLLQWRFADGDLGNIAIDSEGLALKKRALSVHRDEGFERGFGANSQHGGGELGKHYSTGPKRLMYAEIARSCTVLCSFRLVVIKFNSAPLCAQAAFEEVVTERTILLAR
jgi:hypothetical protein